MCGLPGRWTPRHGSWKVSWRGQVQAFEVPAPQIEGMPLHATCLQDNLNPPSELSVNACTRRERAAAASEREGEFICCGTGKVSSKFQRWRSRKSCKGCQTCRRDPSVWKQGFGINLIFLKEIRDKRCTIALDATYIRLNSTLDWHCWKSRLRVAFHPGGVYAAHTCYCSPRDCGDSSVRGTYINDVPALNAVLCVGRNSTDRQARGLGCKLMLLAGVRWRTAALTSLVPSLRRSNTYFGNHMSASENSGICTLASRALLMLRLHFDVNPKSGSEDTRLFERAVRETSRDLDCDSDWLGTFLIWTFHRGNDPPPPLPCYTSM